MFHFDFFLGSDELVLSSRMNDFWTSFAVSHVPVASGAPAWGRYSTAQDNYLRLDLGSNMTTINNLKKSACDVWDAYLAAHPLPDN